jgi:hypothetical protein
MGFDASIGAVFCNTQERLICLRSRASKSRTDTKSRSHLKALVQAISFLYHDDDGIVYTGRSWGFGEVAGTESDSTGESL